MLSLLLPLGVLALAPGAATAARHPVSNFLMTDGDGNGLTLGSAAVNGASGDVVSPRRRLTSDEMPEAIHFHFEALGGMSFDCDATLEKGGMFTRDARIVLAREGAEMTVAPPASTTFTSKESDCVLTFLSPDLSFDGLIVKDGKIFHIHSDGGEAVPTVEDEETSEPLRCGVRSATSSGEGGSGRRLRAPTDTHYHDITTFGRRLKVDRWTNCYSNDDVTRTLSIGVAMGSKAFERFGSSDAAAAFIASVVAESNFIYKTQLNIVLAVGSVYLQEVPRGAPAWNDGTCSSGIGAQMDAFQAWERPSEQGLWHLINDCFGVNGGVAGLGTIGTICQNRRFSGKAYNNAVTFITSNTWKTFAHEVGHNFGARHSFEDGQGKTGGIMDYGDGKLNGEYQFNTKYRKGEICAALDSVVSSCKHFAAFEAKCGNGIVEEGEECECESGTSCRCCNSCKLDAGAVCSPDAVGGSCCSSQCQFEPTSTTCEVPSGGGGYCSAGTCASPVCSNFGFGDFCGVHSDNDCKQSCLVEGSCNRLHGWVLRGSGEPLNHVKDGSICSIDGAATGVCASGSCIVAPGNPRTPSPTKRVTARPTERVTARPTERVTARPTKRVTARPTERVTANPTKRVTTTPPSSAEPTPCNPNDISDGLVCKSGKQAPFGQWSACGSGREKFSERKYCPPGWFMCHGGRCTQDEDGCSGSGVKYGAELCSPQTEEPSTGGPSCNPNDKSDGLVCKSGKLASFGQWSACGRGKKKLSGRKFCPPGFYMCRNGRCTKSANGCRGSGGVKYGAVPCSTTAPTDDGSLLEAKCAALACANGNELCTRRGCDTSDECAVVRSNGKMQCIPRQDTSVGDICAALNRGRVSWTKNWCQTEKGCGMKRRRGKWRCVEKTPMS